MRFASVPALEAAQDFAERGCHRFIEHDLSHFLTKAAVGKTVNQKKNICTRILLNLVVLSENQKVSEKPISEKEYAFLHFL